MAITDALIVIAVVLVAELVRFGDDNLGSLAEGPRVDHIVRLIALTVAWILALRVFDSYDPRMLGHGPEEYRAVIKATFVVFATIAIGSYVLKAQVARGYVVIALPVGLFALLVGRWIWRQWLVRNRVAGRHVIRTIVVGSRERLELMIRSLHSMPGAGYRVIGACVSDDDRDTPVEGVRILGDAKSAAKAARREGADVVAVVSALDVEGGLRNLSWELEGTDTDLIVVPG
ncbi:MAG: hypothetical protein Q4G46_01800, partial [Propionibacteriaceae bacterium]|nr:hypothetical protein [Propionibacteriaceae bacterium]